MTNNGNKTLSTAPSTVTLNQVHRLGGPADGIDKLQQSRLFPSEAPVCVVPQERMRADKSRLQPANNCIAVVRLKQWYYGC